eukprot:7335882-Pyramimonas_sp.AAC.1
MACPARSQVGARRAHRPPLPPHPPHASLRPSSTPREAAPSPSRSVPRAFCSRPPGALSHPMTASRPHP